MLVNAQEEQCVFEKYNKTNRRAIQKGRESGIVDIFG